MQLLIAVITAISAIVGVTVGGFLSSRNQRAHHDATIQVAYRRDRQEACVAFLAASRKYRRFLMYSNLQIELVEATDASKGGFAIEGSSEYRADLDEAFARLLIIADSDEITAAAARLNSLLGKLVRDRAREGLGKIRNEIVSACRDEELNFAVLVRQELRSN